ncbi:MAG TPA: LamG domain-containing protein, partial [Planctomycetota bacterium]|nr:LamG domain-containing protein [Planctomycetota bacterium]
MQKPAFGIILVSALVGIVSRQDVRGDLISHWHLDGDLGDIGAAGNDGEFRGDVAPFFVEGHDGTPEGAVQFDGLDDFIEVTAQSGLPIYNHAAYSVALWVNGGPQPDRRVFSESSTTSNTPLFNIGTQNNAAGGAVDIYIRTAGNQAVVNHRWSTAIVFDNTWHHIAWVDNNGQAVLYVDGVRDLTDFTYTKTDQPFNRTTIGGILRAAPSHWFTGSIDDVRVYDHALSEFEVQALIPEPPGCPAAGDTHCGSVSVTGPPGDLVGTYTATAIGAVDDSGDPIRYLFEAESDTGGLVRVGPQPEASADLDLGRGTWTISVTVDDDPACSDLAPDAKCSAAPIVVSCFAA